jgi:ABC-type phosphate/phosphonate transport system ATPase subunit
MVEKMLSFNTSSLVRRPSNPKKDREKEKEKLTSRQKNIFKLYQFIKEQHKVENITLGSFKFYKRIGEGAFG